MQKSDFFFKHGSIGLISVWLGLFALVPLLLVLVISVLTPNDESFYSLPITLSNYTLVFTPLYLHVFFRSLVLAGVVTLVCLLVGYPFAFFIATMKRAALKPLLLALMIIPFWTSSLIRTYAIVTILKAQGPLNMFLLHIGIIHQPLQLLYTQTAVLIGLVYSLLPYMILPLYANIEKLDHRLVHAAYDLGASPRITFFRVIIPVTLPGIIAGCILVFLPAMTLFYIPNILGGAKSLLLGNLISNQFLEASNWPFGAALSVVLTVLLLLMLLVLRHVNARGGVAK